MIEDLPVLSGSDHEQLLRVIEFSLQVRKRPHFYLWSQGHLRGLIPHDLIFCAYGNYQEGDLHVAQCAAAPLTEKQMQELGGAGNNFLLRSHTTWQERGETALAVSSQGEGGLYDDFREGIERHQLGNLLVHGAPQLNGCSSLFVLARMETPPNARLAYLLELVMPHLHMAFMRTLLAESRQPKVFAPSHKRQPLTRREAQILHWVREGKSNREIAVVLKISPLTVKNHVQNMLRKLKVNNRAQAVARGISLRITSREDE